MINKENKNLSMKQPCESCNGTGQTSFFQGESRFLLTYDECSDCYGTGLEQQDADSDDLLPDQDE